MHWMHCFGTRAVDQQTCLLRERASDEQMSDELERAFRPTAKKKNKIMREACVAATKKAGLRMDCSMDRQPIVDTWLGRCLRTVDVFLMRRLIGRCCLLVARTGRQKRRCSSPLPRHTATQRPQSGTQGWSNGRRSGCRRDARVGSSSNSRGGGGEGGRCVACDRSGCVVLAATPPVYFPALPSLTPTHVCRRRHPAVLRLPQHRRRARGNSALVRGRGRRYVCVFSAVMMTCVGWGTEKA